MTGSVATRWLVLTTVLATLALAPTASAQWLSNGGNVYNTRYSTKGPSAGKGTLPTKIWEAQLDPGIGEILGTPIVATNGLVYVATTTGKVLAYLRDGRKGAAFLYWAQSASGTQPAPIYSSALVTPQGHLYVVVSASRAVQLVRLDPVTGDVLSRVVVDTQSNTEAYASPVYSPETGLIYVAVCMCKAEEANRATTSSGALIAVDPVTSTVRWKVPTSSTPGGGVAGTPLVLDELDRVIVATGHSYSTLVAEDPLASGILAFNSLTGALVGAFNAHDDDSGSNTTVDPQKAQGFAAAVMAYSAPTPTPTSDIAVGAPSRDGHYYALDAATMVPIYTTRVGVGSFVGGSRGDSAVDSRRVVGRSSLPGLIWGVEKRLGGLQFAVPSDEPLNYGPITLGGNVAWHTDQAGFLNATDPATGRPIGRTPLGAPSIAGVSLSAGKLFAAIGTGHGTGGGIVAFK